MSKPIILSKRSSQYLLLFSFLFIIGISFLSPFLFLLNFSHDDSFYYLKTAQNILKGLGSTFDGISPSNGYHPAWLMVVTAYFFVLKLIGNFTPEILYRFIFFLHFFIFLMITILVYKIFLKLYDRKTAFRIFLLTLLLSIIFVILRGVGIESIFNCLILSLILFLKTTEIYNDKSFPVSKALLLSVLFLGRTDYLFSIIPALIIADYITNKKELRNRSLLLQIILTALISSLYFLFNYYFFGHIISVSSLKLITFPEIVFARNINSMIETSAMVHTDILRLLFFIFILLFVTLKLLLSKKENKNFKAFTIFLLAAGYGSLFFCLIHLCFNSEGLREWYFTLPMFVSILLSIYLFETMLRYWKILFISIFAFAVIVIYKTRIDSWKFSSVYDYSKLLSSQIGKDEAVYQVDFAGILSFFSERKIVNGDGFINSFEYYQLVKSGRLRDYFKKYNINLYSTYTIEKKEWDSIFIDEKFKIKGSGFSFAFPRENLILSASFDFKHLQGERTGNWYLFKMENE